MSHPYPIRCPVCQRPFEMTEAYHIGEQRYCSEACRSDGLGSSAVEQALTTPDSREASPDQLNDGIWFPTDERRQMR